MEKKEREYIVKILKILGYVMADAELNLRSGIQKFLRDSRDDINKVGITAKEIFEYVYPIFDSYPEDERGSKQETIEVISNILATGEGKIPRVTPVEFFSEDEYEDDAPIYYDQYEVD